MDLGGSIWRAVLLLAAIPVWLSAQDAAQETGNEPATLRVDTRLVQVDVVVTDDDGPVGDLAAADFHVLDEGVERNIDVFRVNRTTRDTNSGIELPDGAVSNRLDSTGHRPESATVILVDRLNTLAPDQPFADSQVRKFLADSAEASWVAVYELSDEGLTRLADFTSSPDDVRSALNGRRPRQSLALQYSLCILSDTQIDPELAAETSINLNSAPDGSTDRIDVEHPPSVPPDDLNPLEPTTVQDFCPDPGEPLLPYEQRVAESYLNLRALDTASAMEALVRHLADLPGRKNLVWLASSFPFTFDPHQDPRFYNAVPLTTLDRVADVSRLMIEANVAVYPIDARGVEFDIRRPREIGVMRSLAETTGGRVGLNTNGLAGVMSRAVLDARVTYTLGFYLSEAEPESDFHEIEVTVDRDDVDVHHRRGYYGVGEEPAPNPYEALMSAFDATSLGLVARAESIDGREGSYDLAVIADVDDMGLSRDGDFWTGSLTVLSYYVAADEKSGLVLEPETYPVRLTEGQLALARRVGFIVQRTVETGGQPGYLRVVVQATDTGAIGSVWVPLGL